MEEEVAAAVTLLRAEIAAILDDRRHTIEETKWEEAAAHAAALTAGERERRAVDLASQRVQAMTRAVAANLSSNGGNNNSRHSNNRTGPSIAQMKVELQILRDEEEVRARRISGIESDIQGTQARIGQQAQAYEVVLRQIADVKAEFAAREVR